MKRFIVILGSLSSFCNLAWGAGGFVGLSVSSGTYQAISTYSNDDGGNRQAIVIGNRTSSDTVKTDGSGAMVAYVINPTTTTITGTVPVSGTFWQATQPVSGTFWQATQPISGTVTAAQAIDAALGASVSIKGSSNTVQITGTPTVNVTQAGGNTLTTAASGQPRVSCELSGSSNTVQVTGTVSVSGSSGGGIIQQLQGGTTVSIGYGNVITSVPVSIQNASIAISGALTANQSVNVAQVGGNNTTLSGTAGQQRVSVEIQASSNTVKAAGDVANAVTDSGNPVKIGGVGRTTYQTAVTDGQRVDGQFDSEGKQVVMPYAVPALSTSGVTVAMTATAENVLVSSGGSNINTYITGLSCFNSHATVGTVINLRNGRTIRYTGYAIAAGGGFVVTFQTPIAGASNTQWTAENATTGSNTYCDAVGYFAKN